MGGAPEGEWRELITAARALQMNDAGNHYLGVGVEIPAAGAAPAAQETWVGLGGGGQAALWRIPLYHLLLSPILPPWTTLPPPTPTCLPSPYWVGRCLHRDRGPGRWDLGSLSPGRAMPRPLPASGPLSLTPPQVQGMCAAAWGRCPLLLALPLQMWPAGGGLGHHIAFPGLPGPQASGWDES